jgi:hypothetical protein
MGFGPALIQQSHPRKAVRWKEPVVFEVVFETKF